MNAIAGIGVGLLFGCLGLAICIDYKGMATWHVKRTIGLHPTSTLDRPKDRAHFDRQFRREQLIGAAFLGAGVLALVSGLVGLLELVVASV